MVTTQSEVLRAVKHYYAGTLSKDALRFVVESYAQRQCVFANTSIAVPRPVFHEVLAWVCADTDYPLDEGIPAPIITRVAAEDRTGNTSAGTESPVFAAAPFKPLEEN